MSDAFTGRPEFNREEAQPWARERRVVFTEQPASVDAASDETDDSRASFSITVCEQRDTVFREAPSARCRGCETRRVSRSNVQARFL